MNGLLDCSCSHSDQGECNVFKETLFREELSVTGFSRAGWWLLQSCAWPPVVSRGEVSVVGMHVGQEIAWSASSNGNEDT